MAQKKRVTLQEVAVKVGVTKMTVSRYLRNPESVAPATAERIALAVEQLGYVESHVPSMLSRSSSRAIGVIIPSLSNQVFAAFIRGVESVTHQHGYNMLIAHTRYSDAIEEAKVATFLGYHVDGLILTATAHTPRTLAMVRQAATPVVEAMAIPQSPIDMAVGMDHKQAAYDITLALIKKGRTHVTYLAARMDERTKMRLEGYQAALQHHNLSEQIISTTRHSDFSLGKVLMKKALTTYPSTDAVMCTNDDIAVGAQLYCSEVGVTVPGDMAIVGYNALDIGLAMTPPLTSVASPREEIGAKAATMLVERLAGAQVSPSVITLPYSISGGGTW